MLYQSVGGHQTCHDLHDNQMEHAFAGATGLVGTRLVEQLLQQNAKVKILSRNPEKSRSKLRFPGVEFYDPSQWQDAMRGITGVINLAGTTYRSCEEFQQSQATVHCVTIQMS